jgi:hypothetical protein
MRSSRLWPTGLWVAGALLGSACAIPPRDTRAAPAPITVSGRSHHRSDVDVYMLCGDRDARLLGSIEKKGAAVFEVPGEAARCATGLNFFFVVRDRGRGYWVGPVRTRPGGLIELVIEKYAPLSTASASAGDVSTWSGYLR